MTTEIFVLQFNSTLSDAQNAENWKSHFWASRFSNFSGGGGHAPRPPWKERGVVAPLVVTAALVTVYN